MTTKTEAAAVEVLLENGTIATKRVTAKRTYAYALVTDAEVISWHTERLAADRAWYRAVASRRIDGNIRIVPTRMA